MLYLVESYEVKMIDIQCVLIFPDKTSKDIVLGSAPHVGDKIKTGEIPLLKVDEVFHVARGANSKRPEPHVELRVSGNVKL